LNGERFPALAHLWQERRLLASAFAGANGVGFLPLLVLPWTLGELISSGRYSATMAGWIATAEICALATTSLLFAKAATRTGRRWLAAGGTILALLANVCSMLVPGGTAFVVTRLLSGAGLGCAVAVGNATASSSLNPSRTFAGMWFAMALWQLIVYNVTPWVIQSGGLAAAYGLLAAVCALFLPLIILTPDPRRNPIETADGTQPARAPLRWLPATLMIIAFVTFWLRDALVYSLSQVVAATRGVSAQQLGQLLGLASLFGFVGPALAARFAERGARTPALAAGLIAVLLVSLAITAGSSARTLMAGLFLMPLAGLFTTPLLSGLAAQVDETGRLPALCAGVGFFSQAFGSAIGASLLESGGLEALTVAVLIAGAATLLSATSCRA
jgi:predicted MFS family arabinose efflux permease